MLSIWSWKWIFRRTCSQKFKTCKATNINGNVFTIYYATLNFLGKITSHLTFNKSNAEIAPIIKNIERIRTIANADDLQRHDTDNVNGDALLLENYFITLTQGTIKLLKKVTAHHLFLRLLWLMMRILISEK